MAVDALEYDDTAEDANPAGALEEILESPERLKDLDLDAFAEELERQVDLKKKMESVKFLIYLSRSVSCTLKLLVHNHHNIYSQTCIKRSPLGQIDSGILRQVTS